MRRAVKIYYYFEEEDKKAFRDLLKANEINQEIFCKKFEISRTYLSLVLNGKRACPDFIHAFLRKRVVYKTSEQEIKKKFFGLKELAFEYSVADLDGTIHYFKTYEECIDYIKKHNRKQRRGC